MEKVDAANLIKIMKEINTTLQGIQDAIERLPITLKGYEPTGKRITPSK